MHWAMETAKRLIEENPNLETFVCASGISPSGQVHIGNFREILTTYFVIKSLESLGKKTRFIFSWDDYDRFRKVPEDVLESFSEHIGKPYSEVPDPFGCHESYAAHYEAQFETTLKAFGITPEFIYQSEAYQRGRYLEDIREALIKRREIYDIQMQFKTQTWNEVSRERSYPITLYCRNCGKDDVLRMVYDDTYDTLEYHCSCGHHEITELESFNRIKLNWKIDWSMRWRKECVVFEPGGRDHSSRNGSFTVASKISNQIFNYKPPHYMPYEFIGLKGNKTKMSSSTGLVITPDELLKVYPKEIILYLFAKYKNTDAFDIGLDDDVIRLYTEFERHLKRFKEHKIDDERLRTIMMLSSAEQSTLDREPKFSLIASTLPLVNFNINVLYRLFSRTIDQDMETFKVKCAKATYWIRNWHQERAIQINEKFNAAFYSSLNAPEKKWVKAFVELIVSFKGSDEALIGEIYEIVQANTANERKKMQKRFFEVIYQLVLGQKSGPNIAILVEVVGVHRLRHLLVPKKITYVESSHMRVS
ncbi:lysine--tRNA ligase [Fusibacter ferrireducens]|uniref:Lysine--tRNA ligase n=1 Tax=Fusibacter ferrireducens TaxID=2785058 RepID=A0ABR9ZUJ6_9FIRM|nr:lysine--tRNA ligase [Fusibacter ferrireducens]MBF4693555.1 lysine--tRNA ligase [Fusibacter ferrireducens]